MSYHKFTNLSEIFQGDLTTKLLENVQSEDFMDRPCNCTRVSMVDGSCDFDACCRKTIVVYKATCTCLGKYYIGNTNNFARNELTNIWQR